MAELNDLIYHFSNDGLNINVEIRPLVKCKECKYWYPNGIGFCTIHDIRPSQLDMADWFCADGEEQTDDNT